MNKTRIIEDLLCVNINRATGSFYIDIVDQNHNAERISINDNTFKHTTEFIGAQILINDDGKLKINLYE